MDWYKKCISNGWLENKEENYEMAIAHLIVQAKALKALNGSKELFPYFESGINKFFGKRSDISAKSKEQKKIVEAGIEWARQKWHSEILIDDKSNYEIKEVDEINEDE